MLGWYDVIELVYGPPGHTHNGGDQQHQIHNEVLGNFTSPTFAHFIARYPQAWRQEHTRPTPCVLDVQYDWDAYYKPFVNPIGGFTKTEPDPLACRGFQFARGADGIVAMKWKTKAESGEWRGADGQVGTAGFVVLKGLPRGAPGLIEPLSHIMEKKYFKQLTGTKMTECLEAENAPEARAWLKKAAKHGVMPVHRRLQQPGEITPGEYGAKVELKCGDVTAVVQLIEEIDVTAKEFWALPAEVERVLSEGRERAEAQSVRHQQHPAVGYKNVPVRKRPTYEGSAAQARAIRLAAEEGKHESDEDTDGDDGSESDSDSSSSDDDAIVNNASRSAPRQERPKRRQNVQAERESAEATKEITHDVLAVFGAGDNGPELWLGVKVQCRAANKVRMQFLQLDEDSPPDEPVYIVSDQCDSYTEAQIMHRFIVTDFIETTTYKLTAQGKRKKTGKEVKTRTKAPFDKEELAELLRECNESAAT
jgi:hypothetical protein